MLSALVHMSLLFLSFSNRISPSGTRAMIITVSLEGAGTPVNPAPRHQETTPAPVNKVTPEQHRAETLHLKHVPEPLPNTAAVVHPPRRKSAIVETPPLPLPPAPAASVATPAVPTDDADEYSQRGTIPPEETHLTYGEMPNMEQVTTVGILVGKDGIVEQAHVLVGTGNTMLDQAAIQFIRQKNDFNLLSDAKYPVDMVFMVHHRFIGNQVMTYIPPPTLSEWLPFK